MWETDINDDPPLGGSKKIDKVMKTMEFESEKLHY